MTDDEQRIAIAEAVGWTGIRTQRHFVSGWPDFLVGVDPRLNCEQAIPDFLNDLNAIHEAEEMLHPNECEHFAFTLQNIVGQFWYNKGKSTINFSQEAWLYATAHATARQRAQALQKTLGLWKK